MYSHLPQGMSEFFLTWNIVIPPLFSPFHEHFHLKLQFFLLLNVLFLNEDVFLQLIFIFVDPSFKLAADLFPEHFATKFLTQSLLQTHGRENNKGHLVYKFGKLVYIHVVATQHVHDFDAPRDVGRVESLTSPHRQ